MSDESKDTPPAKLKLSRDLKAQDEAEPKKAPPSMKLRRMPTEPDSPTEPKPNTATPSTTPETPATPPSSGDSAEKAGFDPKKPFGDAIKQGEIKTPASPPPELPSKPAPKVDDGSGAKVEEAIDSLNDEEGAAPKSHLLPSILTLCALLLVLAAAGYGLWHVLQAPDTPDAATSETGTTAPAENDAEAPKKGPIQKAKEAIAKVPVADVDAIAGEAAPEEPPAEAPATTTTPPENAGENFEPAPPPASASVEANKQSVAQYLSGIHIGGVRKGERPMILIDGESFLVGELVHAETGLKFDGLRDGKLAFRDNYGIVYLKSF